MANVKPTDQPNQVGANYKIDLKIDDINLIHFVKNIRITNSINALYPIVLINMNIDTSSIILYDLFGQKPINLTITLMGEDQLPKEVFSFTLIYLESSLNLIAKIQQGNQQDHDRQPTSFHCIVLPCYKIMSTGVNSLFEETAGMTPLDCVSQVLKDSGLSDDQIQIDDKGKNTEIINQIVIPPMSVIRCIDYIHEKYGLYSGALFRYCNIDPKTLKPVLIFKDLSKTISNKASLVIWQMPVGSDGKKGSDIIEKCIDDINFFTNVPIYTNNYSNSNVITFRYNKCQIIHPEDNLFDIQSFTIDDIVKKFGTSEKKELVFFKNELSNIETKYCTDLKGFAYESPYNDCCLTSRMSNQLKSTFQITVKLVHNLHIKNLLQIGTTVRLEPAVSDFMKYSGNYILKNSDILFSKSGDQWETTCDLQLFRSSRTNS